jgi:hypothetical protein
MAHDIHLPVCKGESVANEADWRRSMRRGMMWLLTIKFAALILLWWLFFSPPHRQHIDGKAASEHLEVVPGMSVSGTKPQSGENTRD